MSFLRSGGRGVRKAGAVFAAMLVFQVLAVVGAGTASAVAVTGCAFNPSNGTVTITQEPANDFEIYVNVDDEIRVYDAVTGDVDCGSATTANTTDITVLGGGVTGSSETIEIENDDNGGLVVNGGGANCCFPFDGQNFSIDLGEDGAGTDADVFSFQGTDGDDEVTLGGTQNNFTGVLNGGNLLVLGADNDNSADPGIVFDLDSGDDTLDGDGTTARTDLFGGTGADTIMPGVGLGDDVNGGNDAGDTVIYDRGTSPVSVSLQSVGTDADDGANCVDDETDFNDPSQGACEGDDVWNFLVVQTGAGNDFLAGDVSAARGEVLIPGEGDDETVGNGGTDTTAWSNCTGPVTINVGDATTTGCGTDTWDTEMVAGSPAENGETIPNRIPATGPGGEGDWLDLTTNGGTIVDLDGDALINGDWDPIENVLGSDEADEITGDENGNVLNGAEGNDILDGMGGNDMLVGAAGNDTFTGGGGADAVYFGFAEEGVTVDLSLGFATGEGSDTFTGGIPGVDVEIVFGSNFNDDITGGLTGAGSGVNFRFNGKAGNDTLTGADSNDTLAGGAGNDVMRGGAGLDTLKGGKGEDWGYGGPGNDICRKSTEHKRSCGRRG